MKTLVKKRFLGVTIRITLIVVVILLAAILAIKLYGKTERNKAYDYLAKVPGGIPTGHQPESLSEKDAIVWLAAGGKAAVIEEKMREKLKELSSPQRQPQLTPEQVKEAEFILTLNEPAMILLHQAEGLKSSTTPLSLLGVRWDNLPENMWVDLPVTSRLLALEARLAWRRDDLKQFVSSMRLLSAWLDSFEREQPDVMLNQCSQIFGVISENMYAGILREAIQGNKITPAEAVEILGFFPREDLKKRLHDYFTAVAAHSNYPQPINYFMDPYGFKWLVYDFILGDLANARAMEYFIKTAESCDRPYSQVEKTIPKGFYMPTFLGRKWKNDGYQFIIARADGTMAQRQLAIAALKAIEERGRTGQWPSSSSLPADMDPCTCGRLKYEIKTDGSLKLSYPGMVKMCGPKTDKAWNWMISEEWTIPAPGAPTSPLP